MTVVDWIIVAFTLLMAAWGYAQGLIVGAIAAAGLLVCWIAGAVALQTPGARGLRKDIQRSAILKVLNDELPPSGSILNALARFDPFPQIAGPAPGVAPPTSKVARDPQVKAAGRSVVRVLGTACGLGVEGSGGVAKPGVVVTNAHVVAGEDDTTVQIQGTGTHYPAHAIWFDARNDVAILRADGIAGQVQPLQPDVNAKPGTSAAILGY